MEESAENKNSKLKTFFSDKYNLILIAILVIGFIIRLKYLTINTAVWWDEAEYMNMAKHWVFKIPMDLNPQRPILFPLIIAALYKIGANEWLMRFVVELIPSIGAVLLTYLVGKELYNKKIGLIASFIMSVFWLLIFNTTRVHTEALALLFNLLAIYFFWKGYVVQQNKKYLLLMGVFLALGFLTRVIALLIGLIIILFLILTERLKFLKNKNLWLALLLAFVVIIPYLIWSYSYHGNILAFLENYFETGGERTSAQFAWYILTFFKWFSEWFLFIIFLIGLITFYKLILGFDLVLKNKEDKLKSDLFILIWIIVYLVYFVFVQRGAEDRWLLPMAPAVFIVIAKGLMFIHHNIKKYNKVLSILLIIAILSFGAYLQLKHTSEIINLKKDTEYQVREAGLWIKSNTNKNDNVLSNNVYMELQYFAERKVNSLGSTEEDTIKRITELKSKYYITTGFYNSQEWSYTFPQKYPNSLEPIKVYFMDKEQKQPVVIVYAIKNYEFKAS